MSWLRTTPRPYLDGRGGLRSGAEGSTMGRRVLRGRGARSAPSMRRVPSKKRRSTPRPGVARRIFACCLAAFLVVHSSAQASSACFLSGLISGQTACCCAGPPEVEASSCCSKAETGRDAAGTALTTRPKRCACEFRAPEPIPAPPRALRGIDAGSISSLEHWIGSRARESATTPIFECGSRSGEAFLALFEGPCLPCTPPPNFARGARGFLSVICVARC